MANSHDLPSMGDRYRVEESFTTVVATHWRAPFSGGDEKSLPVGLEFVVSNESLPEATAIYATPDPYSDWEKILVDSETRNSAKYDGYSLGIFLDDLEKYCVRVA